MVRWPELVGVWGGDHARPKLASPRVLLGSDPDEVSVLGERDGAVMLEVWDADSGLRRNTIAVARLGQLRSARVWRSDGDDLVVVAVRGLDRNEVALLDVRTGSLFSEQQVPFREHVMAASRDARTRVVFDRDDPRDAGLMAPGGSLRPEMRDGINTYALSADGALVACWNDYTRRVLIIEAPPSVSIVASTDERYAFTAPHMVFADDRTTLWCASAGEVRCFALPSMTELGRWTGASRLAEIVAVSRDGRAALLDGPIAFAIGRDAPVRPRDFSWSPHLARLSPDGTRLAYNSGTIGWYDLTRERHVELHTGGHAGEVLAIACSRDGHLVASASKDRTIRVCDAASGACEWALEGDAEGFSALSFSPDGASLYAVTHGHDPRLTAWSLREGVEVTPARCLVEPGTRVDVSADGSIITLSRSPDRPAQVIDAASFEPVTDAGAATRRVPSRDPDEEPLDARAGWSPDGAWFVDFEERVNPWGRLCVVVIFSEAETMREWTRVETSMRPPLSAASIGATSVLIAGEQGEVQLVDRVTRRHNTVATTLRTSVTALALSPDEATAYVGTENGQVRVYGLRAG